MENEQVQKQLNEMTRFCIGLSTLVFILFLWCFFLSIRPVHSSNNIDSVMAYKIQNNFQQTSVDSTNIIRLFKNDSIIIVHQNTIQNRQSKQDYLSLLLHLL